MQKVKMQTSFLLRLARVSVLFTICCGGCDWNTAQTYRLQEYVYCGDNASSWDYANSICASENASLPRLYSDNDLKFIASLINGSGLDSFFLGLKKQGGVSTAWRWQYGSDKILRHWELKVLKIPDLGPYNYKDRDVGARASFENVWEHKECDASFFKASYVICTREIPVENMTCNDTPCEGAMSTCDPVNPSSNNGLKFSCNCEEGLEGVRCQQPIDYCDREGESMVCNEHGVCRNQVTGHACGCDKGWISNDCSVNRDDCKSNPCQNNSTCIDEVDNYTCACADGFTSRHCETNINDCSSSPCANRGACVDGINSYTCTCDDNYEGIHCENERVPTSPPSTTPALHEQVHLIAKQVQDVTATLNSTVFSSNLTFLLIICLIVLVVGYIIEKKIRKRLCHGKEPLYTEPNNRTSLIPSMSHSYQSITHPEVQQPPQMTNNVAFAGSGDRLTDITANNRDESIPSGSAGYAQPDYRDRQGIAHPGTEHPRPPPSSPPQARPQVRLPQDDCCIHCTTPVSDPAAAAQLENRAVIPGGAIHGEEPDYLHPATCRMPVQHSQYNS